MVNDFLDSTRGRNLSRQPIRKAVRLGGSWTWNTDGRWSSRSLSAISQFQLFLVVLPVAIIEICEGLQTYAEANSKLSNYMQRSSGCFLRANRHFCDVIFAITNQRIKRAALGVIVSREVLITLRLSYVKVVWSLQLNELKWEGKRALFPIFCNPRTIFHFVLDGFLGNFPIHALPITY